MAAKLVQTNQSVGWPWRRERSTSGFNSSGAGGRLYLLQKVEKKSGLTFKPILSFSNEKKKKFRLSDDFFAT